MTRLAFGAMREKLDEIAPSESRARSELSEIAPRFRPVCCKKCRRFIGGGGWRGGIEGKK
jgi:hypothetical protein